MAKSNRTTDWLLTQHAVERYVERFEPSSSYDSARRTLMAALPSAKRLRTNTLRGHYRWVVPELHGGVVVIVKEDRRRVVVTVEPLHDLDRNFADDWRDVANQLYIKDEEFREAERRKYRDTKPPKNATTSGSGPMTMPTLAAMPTPTVTSDDSALELERLRSQRANDERKLATLLRVENARKRKHEMQLVDRYTNEALLKDALAYMVARVAKLVEGERLVEDGPEEVLKGFVKTYPDFAKIGAIKSTLDAVHKE